MVHFFAGNLMAQSTGMIGFAERGIRDFTVLGSDLARIWVVGGDGDRDSDDRDFVRFYSADFLS
jgi:hypothetical protein